MKAPEASGFRGFFLSLFKPFIYNFPNFENF